VADAVPERYKARAVRIDTQASAIPVERAEAARRELARASARLEQARQEREHAAAAAAAEASAPSTLARIGSRATAGPPEPDCAALRRAYAASQECFAPFQNANGSMKPGAFEACVELPDPSPICGIPTAPR
jgi:sRNA-binding protein